MAKYNKFHFNPIDGSVKRCNLLIPCAYGFSSEEHFESKQEAVEHLNIHYSSEYFNVNNIFVSEALGRMKINFTISENVLLQSNKIIYFTCEFGHIFNRAPKQWFTHPVCPDCLKVNSSIESNEKLLSEFSPNNVKKSSEVRLLEKVNYLWNCERGHEFSQSPWHRFTLNYGCAICSKKTFKSGVNDLLTTNSELCKEWVYERNRDIITPSEVTTGSKILVWWRCSKGHEWKARINDRANSNKSGCHMCAGSAMEDEVDNFLKILAIPFERRDRKVIKPRELDFYFPELNIAIEFNGEYFHSDKFLKESYGMGALKYHSFKLDACNSNGIALLFIWEDDWKKNGALVKSELSNILLSGNPINYSQINPIFKRLVSNRD